MSRRVQLLNAISAFLRRAGGRNILMGNWDLVPTGEGRLRGDGETTSVIEHPTGSVYSNTHPTGSEHGQVQSSVRGGWTRRGAVSDHPAVQVRFTLRSSSGRQRLKVYVMSSPHFSDTYWCEEQIMLSIVDKNIRCKSIAVAAYAAQRRTLRNTCTDINPGLQQVADICLIFVRLWRQGRGDEIHAIALEVPETAACATGAAVDIGKLGQRFQDCLGVATALELTALQRSAAQEVQEIQGRKRAKLRMEPHLRAQRRRALDGVYGEWRRAYDGGACGQRCCARMDFCFRATQHFRGGYGLVSSLCSPGCGAHGLDMASRTHS